MIRVQKRDGEIAVFSLDKIKNAIKKAFIATNMVYDDEILNLLALRVSADFQAKVKENLVNVEDIQDSVEHVLEQSCSTKVANAYILYRKHLEKIRNKN